MTEIVFYAQNESDTDRLGKVLAETLPPGTVVTLLGTLGAGKTRLVRSVAESLGVEPGTVVSPTFVLIREYAGKMPVYHFDAYRLADEDEFDRLGPDEYFDGNGLSFVEWADRVALSIPPDRLEISVDVLSTTERRFTLHSCGGFSASVWDTLVKKLVS